MTVKEYSAEQHISQQTVYYKIKKYSNKLKSHIYKQGGKILLDETAQEMLKPIDGNAGLVYKMSTLEEKIVKLKSDVAYFENNYLRCKEKSEELTKEVSEKQKHIADLEQELSDEKAKNAEMEKTISELTAKVFAFENFAERLNALLGVLEENANTGMGKKIGNLLSEKH